MGLNKKIAMRCTQEQFEAIKPKLEKIGDICGLIGAFEKYEYITNNFNSNISEKLEFDFINSNKGFYYCHNGNIHEQWNEKVFLKACGIEKTPTLEEVKEYFKDAKTVECLTQKSEENISSPKGKGIHYDMNVYWIEAKGVTGKYTNLWESGKGYAKILTYKIPKFEITKETILKYNMKDEFPEVFETKLEPWKWYKGTYLMFTSPLLFVTNLNNNGELKGFGIDCDGVFFDNRDSNKHYGSAKDTNDWIEATPQEVEEALIREAKKRGFEEAVFVVCNTSGDVKLSHNGDFYFSENLYYKGANIFKNGKWATIIPAITKEDAENFFNCKII